MMNGLVPDMDFRKKKNNSDKTVHRIRVQDTDHSPMADSSRTTKFYPSPGRCQNHVLKKGRSEDAMSGSTWKMWITDYTYVNVCTVPSGYLT